LVYIRPYTRSIETKMEPKADSYPENSEKNRVTRFFAGMSCFLLLIQWLK